MGKEEESCLGSESHASYNRTPEILQAIAEKGLELTMFVQMPIIDRLRMLSPAQEIIQETIKQGNLAILIPSMGRLYRIFGRLPSQKEVYFELTNGKLFENASLSQVNFWFEKVTQFFELFRPEVEEYAIHRWRIEKRYRLDLDRDEFINEAHVATREAFLFNYDWTDPNASPNNYLMAYVKDWLTGYSLWYNEFSHRVVEFEDRPPAILYREGVSDEDLLLSRLQAQQDIAIALEKLNKQEQQAIRFLLGFGKKEELNLGSPDEFELLQQRALRSLATQLGIEKIKGETITLDDVRSVAPNYLFVSRKPPYSKKYPPFTQEKCSVFARLNLLQVFWTISRLTVVDQFLVLSYLGYFPFKNQKELAAQIGYASDASLQRNKSIGYLTKQLATFCSHAEQIGINTHSCELPSLHQLITNVKENLRGNKIKMTKDTIQRAGRLKSPYQSYLAGVDIVNDEMYAEKYRRLTDLEKRIFDQLTLRDQPSGLFVFSINSLAQKLGMDRSNLRIILKNIVKKFERESFGRQSVLRQKAINLSHHPDFIRYLQTLPLIQQTELRLFLGLSSEDGKHVFPHDIPAISKQLSRERHTVHFSIATAVERLTELLKN